MTMVNMHDAKSRLSQLVEAVQSGAEAEVVIAKNGVPAARIVAIRSRQKLRWGLAKGKWVIPDDFDALNSEIEKLFSGDDA